MRSADSRVPACADIHSTTNSPSTTTATNTVPTSIRVTVVTDVSVVTNTGLANISGSTIVRLGTTAIISTTIHGPIDIFIAYTIFPVSPTPTLISNPSFLFPANADTSTSVSTTIVIMTVTVSNTSDTTDASATAAFPSVATASIGAAAVVATSAGAPPSLPATCRALADAEQSTTSPRRGRSLRHCAFTSAMERTASAEKRAERGVMAARRGVPASAVATFLLLAAACATSWATPARADAWPRPANLPARSIKSEGDPCVTPDGRAGVCRVINDCPAMLQLLEGRPSQENIILLNRARCGFQGSVPVVCCAGQGSPVPPQGGGGGGYNPRPGGGGGGGGGGGYVDSSGPPRDVSRHPNLRILPQDRCSPGGTDRIVGGKVADVFAYPWIARLGYRSSRSRPNSAPSYRCGGSLVTERYVLTAAHCVAVRRDLQLVSVRLGEHTIGNATDCRSKNGGCIPPPIDVDVEQAVVHPEYDSSRMHHDIALVRLVRRVDFWREEFVRPVCLPVGRETQNLRLEGTPLVVAGWGTTETGETSPALLDVYVPAVSVEKCREAYRKLTQQTTIVAQQLCAGGVKGRDSCTGDSGGPLMHEADVAGETKTVQFGVVSYGPKNCGTDGVPGVYTRVAYYMQWILDTMRP